MQQEQVDLVDVELARGPLRALVDYLRRAKARRSAD